MKIENLPDYSEIENLIIIWSNDGSKTAGALTREILTLIQKNKNWITKNNVIDILNDLKADDSGELSSIAEHTWNEIFDKKIQTKIDDL